MMTGMGQQERLVLRLSEWGRIMRGQYLKRVWGNLAGWQEFFKQEGKEQFVHSSEKQYSDPDG